MRWRARQRRHPLGWTLSVGAREPVRTARTRFVRRSAGSRSITSNRRVRADEHSVRGARDTRNLFANKFQNSPSIARSASHPRYAAMLFEDASRDSKYHFFVLFFLLTIRFWCFVFLFRTSTDKMASCPNEVQTRGEGYENATS